MARYKRTKTLRIHTDRSKIRGQGEITREYNDWVVRREHLTTVIFDETPLKVVITRGRYGWESSARDSDLTMSLHYFNTEFERDPETNRWVSKEVKLDADVLEIRMGDILLALRDGKKPKLVLQVDEVRQVSTTTGLYENIVSTE